ncbi:hypothetical protein QU668_04305 [Schaalia sp. HMT-877]|nr:hypothetical protein QU668_04305 [Schaalia sp. HMT-877]
MKLTNATIKDNRHTAAQKAPHTNHTPFNRAVPRADCAVATNAININEAPAMNIPNAG